MSTPQRGAITRKGFAALACAGALAALAGAAPADGGSGPEAQAPADYDSAPCAKCHAALLRRKSTHSALSTGGCADCHASADKPGKCKGAGSKGWKLVQEDPKLCAKCHDKGGKAPAHPVVETLGCTACHDPHGSAYENNLKIWPADKLCYGCHDRKDAKKFVHTAVRKGECLGCHDPHSGEAAPLLKAKREELCISCHKAEALAPKPFKHAPAVEGRCLDCHDPHSGNLPKQLRASGKALCLSCHDSSAASGPGKPRPAARIDLKKKNVHAALETGECQDCHEQKHSSDSPKLLSKAPPELCYGCHDRKDGQKFTHGAVKLGDCATCHDPHASDNGSLLRASTPSQLCFRCHQDDVSGRTYIHKPVAEGQCTACHDPHGSANPFNLKKGAGKDACYACHKPKDAVKVKHKALERHGCTSCHDPHATANRFQLLKPVNQLCQGCHPDRADGMHVTTFVPGGHAVSGDFDPRRADRIFSCASCHDPHGSDHPFLFYFGESGMESCDGCHGDRTGKHPELTDIHRRRGPFAPDGGPAPLPAPTATSGAPDGGIPPATGGPRPGTPDGGSPSTGR